MNPVQYYMTFWGMFCTALSIWLIKRRLSIIRTGSRAQGLVIGHKKRVGADSTYFSPVFTFVDHNGVERHIVSDGQWSDPQPKIGTKLDIRYHRENPELAFFDSFHQFLFGQLVLVGFAAALFLIAWYPIHA